MQNKNILLPLLSVAFLFVGVTQAKAQENFGLSKRFGGTEEARDIQLNIMHNTADQLEKTQAVADQMAVLTTNVDRQTAVMLALQKSIERLTAQIGTQADIIREQRDILNVMVRYMARQQQVNDQLLEENRKMRVVLEPKPVQ